MLNLLLIIVYKTNLYFSYDSYIFSSISINKISIWDSMKSYVIACLYCQNTYMREKNTIR